MTIRKQNAVKIQKKHAVVQEIAANVVVMANSAVLITQISGVAQKMQNVGTVMESALKQKNVMMARPLATKKKVRRAVAQGKLVVLAAVKKTVAALQELTSGVANKALSVERLLDNAQMRKNVMMVRLLAMTMAKLVAVLEVAALVVRNLKHAATQEVANGAAHLMENADLKRGIVVLTLHLLHLILVKMEQPNAHLENKFVAVQAKAACVVMQELNAVIQEKTNGVVILVQYVVQRMEIVEQMAQNALTIKHNVILPKIKHVAAKKEEPGEIAHAVLLTKHVVSKEKQNGAAIMEQLVEKKINVTSLRPAKIIQQNVKLKEVNNAVVVTDLKLVYAAKRANPAVQKEIKIGVAKQEENAEKKKKYAIINAVTTRLSAILVQMQHAVVLIQRNVTVVKLELLAVSKGNKAGVARRGLHVRRKV